MSSYWPIQRLELRHFRPSEFRRPEGMEPAFLGLIDECRERAGVPMKVTSDHRTEADMARIYGPERRRWPNSPHLRGRAVDVQAIPNTSVGRMRILWAALSLWHEGAWPLLGLEVATRHLHLDSDDELSRPHLWIDVSR